MEYIDIILHLENEKENLKIAIKPMDKRHSIARRMKHKICKLERMIHFLKAENFKRTQST